MCGLKIECPDAACDGVLKNTRTNFSKNKTLFPIFRIDAGPSWCMVQTMKCSVCCRKFDANEDIILATLPAYAASGYPVEPRFAGNTTSHLHRKATEVFESIMLTCANGELYSKLLFNALNRHYIEKLTGYYSYAQVKDEKPPSYLQKDGQFIKTFPPLGETIRDMFDAAFTSNRKLMGH